MVVNKKNSLIDENLAVFQSHRYEISKLGDKLENLASSQTCKHEIIKHNAVHALECKASTHSNFLLLKVCFERASIPRCSPATSSYAG